MARITVEDCLKRVPNRFLIVNMAAKRVRQIREGSEYLVSSPKNEDIVVALRELAAGKVKLKMTEALPEMQPAPAPDVDKAQDEAPPAIETKATVDEEAPAVDEESPAADETSEAAEAPQGVGETEAAGDEEA